MKAFEISSIVLENIKTYTYEEISFIKGNNVLIGENGAGKSTILESIYLALFGETVPGRSLADMIRTGERQGKITIRFEVDGIKYRIEDEIVRQEKDRGKQFQVLINESIEEAIAKGKTAVKSKIEEILTIDSIAFSSAVYASQGELAKIVTAKDNERKKLFDRLFQLDRFEKTWDNLRKIEKIINRTITDYQKESDFLTTELKNLPELKSKLERTKSQIKEEEKTLRELKKDFTKINQEYSQIEKIVKDYEQLIGEKRTLEKNIRDLETEVGMNCEEIKKLLDEEFICDLKTVKNLQQKYGKKKKALTTSYDRLKEKENTLKSKLEKIEQLKREISRLQNDIVTNLDALNAEISDYLTEVPRLPKDIHLWEEKIPLLLDACKKELAHLKQKERVLQKENDEYQRLNFEYKSLENKKDELESKIVDKRLALGTIIGDNWTETIKKYSTINFEEKITEIDSECKEKEEKREIAIKEKTAVTTRLTSVCTDLQHLVALKGKETCPMCKQALSKETLEKLSLELSNEKKRLSEKEKSLKAKIQELSRRIKELEQLKKQYSAQHELFIKTKVMFDDLKELERAKEKAEKEFQKIKNKLDKLAAKNTLKALESIQDAIQIQEFMKKHLGQITKVLPRLIRKNEFIKEKQEEKKELVTKVKELQQKVSYEKLEAIREKIQATIEEQKAVEPLLEIIQTQVLKVGDLEEKKLSLSQCKAKINEIMSMAGFSKWNDLKTKREEMTAEIAGKKAALSSLKNEVLPPLKDQIRTLEQKEEKAQQIMKELKLEKKKREVVKILRSLMRELPNRLLPNFIQRINKTATEILQSIVPGSDIQNIVLEDDYSLKIIRLGNYENISLLSGGETIVIALALRLAFAKEFSTLDTLILDEPTIFLDERRRSELISVLERTRLVQQLFVVTHDPDFERISDKIFYVSKERGEAKVKPMGTNDEKDLKENMSFDLL
ncbi:MAG: AAA family ATPase [Candidatus Heimdallarchaeota archaeon]|nr:AAA family ATPase [Candidatus Heimdallarchaeota archaeon]